MIDLTDMKWKGGPCWVNYVTLTFDLTHDLDLGFFMVIFRNSCFSGIFIWLMWNKQKTNQIDTGPTGLCTHAWPWPWSFKVKVWNSLISEMGGLIDIRKKGCEFNIHDHDCDLWVTHYDDVIMSAIASLITSLTIVYSAVYSGADQRKHQSSVSLAFVRGIHWGPVNSPHKWPVTRKMFPFDDVIMMMGWVDISDNDCGVFRCRRAVNISSPYYFYPAAMKALSSPEQAGRADKTFALSCTWFFSDHFGMCLAHLWFEYGVLLIKFGRNGPFNEPINFGILGLIFQVKPSNLVQM